MKVGRSWGLALFVVVVLGALIQAVPATAAAPTPWPEERLTAEHWYRDGASAIDGQDRLHVVVRRYVTRSGVTYLRPAGDGWVEEVVTRDASAESPVIALDPSGRPVVAWVHGHDGIEIATRSSGQWTVEQLPVPGVVQGPIALAVDASGRRHLASYRDPDRPVLWYADDRSGAWRTRNLGPVAGEDPAQLVVAPDGTAWLAARMAAQPGRRAGVHAIRIIGDQVRSFRLGVGQQPHVTLDARGRPAVAWIGQHGIHAGRLLEGAWRSEMVARGDAIDLYGFDGRADRLAVAYLSIDDGVAIHVDSWTSGGAISSTRIEGYWFCDVVDLHLLRADAALLPCVTTEPSANRFPPGVGVWRVDGQRAVIRSIAREVRSWTALTAIAPDGRLEVLTDRTDGRLVLHRDGPHGWTSELLPALLNEGAEGFAIGPDGDRGIVTWASGRLVLLADRGGGWHKASVARGFSAQVSIDQHGRYHIGYLVRDGWRIRARVAVGSPGDWRRSDVPGVLLDGEHPRIEFLLAPDGTDVVVWKRRYGMDEQKNGIRLSRSDGITWSTETLGGNRDEDLWSAAVAPDGTVGVVRGGGVSNRLQSIDGDRRSSERLPGVLFLGATLAYDAAARPAVIGAGFGQDSLFLLRRTPDGWERRRIAQRPWDEADLAIPRTGPAIVLSWHEDRARKPGWFVLTQPE